MVLLTARRLRMQQPRKVGKTFKGLTRLKRMTSVFRGWSGWQERRTIHYTLHELKGKQGLVAALEILNAVEKTLVALVFQIKALRRKERWQAAQTEINFYREHCREHYREHCRRYRILGLSPGPRAGLAIQACSMAEDCFSSQDINKAL